MVEEEVRSLQVCVAFAGSVGDSCRSAKGAGRAAAGSQPSCKGEEAGADGDAREGGQTATNVEDGAPKLRKCPLIGARRRRIDGVLCVSGSMAAICGKYYI